MASGLRERKKQQTRELIAETARRLFGERGFERVSVAEIARVADVSEKTVFNYFPTKEDLVYWRLESFEAELLETIRSRQPGESVLDAFGRFVRQLRGMLGQYDAEARERLAALTRMIVESPSLLAREQQIFAGYTASLAALIAGETGAGPDDVQPWVAANAMMGVHRRLIDYTRDRIVAGARHPQLAADVLEQAERGLALLARGLGAYAVREP
ncbi:MAG TPA: TetR family transcriptional regulator [Solirubrobacteraceae bacterium]|nr:TetR family transcriptional regulator [Solirubrobacteraceae bacterium]